MRKGIALKYQVTIFHGKFKIHAFEARKITQAPQFAVILSQKSNRIVYQAI